MRIGHAGSGRINLAHFRGTFRSLLRRTRLKYSSEIDYNLFPMDIPKYVKENATGISVANRLGGFDANPHKATPLYISAAWGGGVSKIPLFRKNPISSIGAILALFYHETTADKYPPLAAENRTNRRGSTAGPIWP